MSDDISKELKSMARGVARGRVSRRDFLGRTAALGISTTIASSMMTLAARAEGPVKGGHFVAGMSGGESTNTLDPAKIATDVPLAVIRHTGNKLVEINPDGTLDMQLAESVEGNDDATEWAFKIRQGVEFHDGKSLTPDDVVATLNRHSDENSESGALGVMQGIADISVDGDYVRIKTESGNADLPFLMTDYHLVIQAGGGVDNPTDPNGTGPYKLVDNEPGVRHSFERNPNHWNPNVGHYDTTELLVINDNTARTASLQAGQVHAINRVEPKVADLMKNAPGVNVVSTSGPGHYVFIMHTNTPPFDNVDLRLALKYAIKRQEMVDRILNGYGSIGNDIPINKAYPLFTGHLNQREFNKELAMEHYANSGHDGSPIILRTADGAFPGAVDAAQLFQASAAECGIPLEVKREPDDGYWSEVWNVQPFCASYWGGRPVQDQMYTTAYQSDADWNDTRFFNDKFDELLVMARADTNTDSRTKTYEEMATIIHNEGGLIAPMFNDFVDAVSDKVQGYVGHPNGGLMYGYAGINTWFSA